MECFEDDPNVVQPDILVICDFENVDENHRYQGKPTLVIEVLSKSTRSKDLVKKLNLYMMSDIPEYWIVNPMDKTIHIYRFKNREMDEMAHFEMGDDIKSFVFSNLIIKTNKFL